MNKNELREILDGEGFSPDCYDLDGGLLPERYTLANEAGEWSVYYSERGLKTGKRSFATESEACEYFLDELREDPTTKTVIINQISALPRLPSSTRPAGIGPTRPAVWWGVWPGRW